MDKLTHEQRRSLYTRILIGTVLLTVCILLMIYVMPQIFSMFAPFIFAYLMAVLLNPLVSKLNQKIRLPRRLLALILVILVFAGLATLLGWFIYSIANEAVSLARNFQSIWDSITAALNFINSKFEWLMDYLPSGLGEMFGNIMDNAYQWLKTASGNFLNSIVSRTATITTKVGSGIMAVFIFIIAAYFTTAEYQTISNLIKKKLSSRMYGHFSMLRDATKSALGGYFKAQLLLALLAFVVMFSALVIYGQAYAFLIALVLAFIDFLPIVGTAVILVPWGVLTIAAGDILKGVFLLILAGAFFLLRRIVEPKIVGSQTGLHPLVALISIYVGMKIFGVWGAILGPIIMMVIISVAKSHIFDNAIKDIKDMFHDISGMLRRRE